MEILLVVTTLAVGVAVLYVTATLRTRTRQNTAPLIDGAVKDISGQIEATAGELKQQLQLMADELQREKGQSRLEGRAIQGRLDHADSRMSGVASQLMAELDTIRRLVEQTGARQDQLGGDLRQLDYQVAQLAEAATQFRPVSHADGEADGEAAEGTAVLAGQFYAERLRFSAVRISPDSFPRAEQEFRIQVERDVAELPGPPLGDLGNASAIIDRAEKDEVFRERLGKTASGYLATKWADPAFAVVTERWVTQNTFPETALAGACNRIGGGLETIVERPLEKIGTELRLPGPEAATAAGIGAALILQPVTEPLGHVSTFLEITGVVVGMATGLHPVALASMKMLVHDQFHNLVARGIREAARELFEEPAPTADLEPARPVDRTPEIGTAPTIPSPSAVWEPSPELSDLDDLGPTIGGPGFG